MNTTENDVRFMPGGFGDYGELITTESRYAVKERHDLFQILPPAAYHSILEVGCANGANLVFFARELGIRLENVLGIDICAEEQGVSSINILHSSLEDYLKSENQCFDIILLSDVLEHIYNPWKVLSEIKSRLSPAGVLLISVPNIENIRYLELVASGRFYYTETGLMDETHIRFFSMETIANALADNGYQLVKAGFRPDLGLEGLRGRVANQLDTEVAVALQIADGVSVTVNKANINRKFGQQILVAASAL